MGTSFDRRRTVRGSMAARSPRGARLAERPTRRGPMPRFDPLRAVTVNVLSRRWSPGPRLPMLGEGVAATGARQAGGVTNRDGGHGEPARGRQHPVSLRYLAPELERRYQRQAGAEGVAGFRIITGTAAIAWPLAALVIPLGTSIPREIVTPICLVMGALSLIPFLFARRVTTLDRQHVIASILTIMNALVILWLASAGRILPGYGVSAILMLFAFGFVSRTGFVFAAVRSAIIGLGFLVAAALYHGGSLLIDAFVFGAGITGTLMALRLLEQSRRRVFYQDVVIGEQAEALRAEKARSDTLLQNVIPAPIAARLMDGERGDRRCLSIGHRPVRRHRRVHRPDLPTPARCARRPPGPPVHQLRRARRGAGPREGEDDRRCVHGRRRAGRAGRRPRRAHDRPGAQDGRCRGAGGREHGLASASGSVSTPGPSSAVSSATASSPSTSGARR